MENLIVVDNPKNWSLKLPDDVPIVSARSYLTEPQFSQVRHLKVFNLCRSYRYQSTGYYVSLLAMARAQRPIPSIATIQDMKTLSITRIVADELSDSIEQNLRSLRSEKFVLSIYFGRNLAHRYDELSQRLFRLFPAPLLRAEFERREGVWRLDSVHPLAASEIPPAHETFVHDAAQEFFAKDRLPTVRRDRTRFDIAVLYNPDEYPAPSDRKALKRFEAAARRARCAVELIQRDDYARLSEFDALFIRETTAMNHHTYRFARRGAAEGLVVIDDPDSIAKCTNKVYLAELLSRNKIPIPKTLIVHRDNREQVVEVTGLPCILKQPDGSFSRGVTKADTPEELEQKLDQLLEDSDLVIAQEFVFTPFDWRIGVLDREPLYACKYHMVGEHWQIAHSDAQGRTRYGPTEAVPLADVPTTVLHTALRAARLIGDGLYGVDMKLVGKTPYVIEINDNPTLESDEEDRILGDRLYDRIVHSFINRIEMKKSGLSRS